MAAYVNAPLIRALIAERFQSVDELEVEWEERVRSGAQRLGRARDRSTVYRWIDRGLPAKRDDIFGFAAVLDIDPVALLDLEGEQVQPRFAEERRLFQLGLTHLSPLSPFWSLYTPGAHWPSPEVARNYFGRAWCAQEFSHGPATIANVYAAVNLQSIVEPGSVAPRTYHFAYRRSGARDGMWRPYGTVIGYRQEVCLISESGDFQKRPDERSSGAVVAETYFGQGPADFRIASLHDFDCSVQAPSSEPAAVRFLA